MFFKCLCLLVAGLAMSAATRAVEPPVISDEMKDAAQRAASNMTTSPDIKARVQEMMKTIQSEEWKARHNAMRAEAMRAVGIEPKQDNITAAAPPPGEAERLYVFISSTMPIEALRNYASDLEKVRGGVMVLRGFVGGAKRVGPTAKFVADFLRRDPSCTGASCEMRRVGVEIDPVVYHRYAITRVPAIVYEEHAKTDGYCSVGLEEASQPQNIEVVYGDASLRYAVETLHQKTKQPGLQRIGHELGGG